MSDPMDTSDQQNDLFGGQVDASSEQVFEEYQKLDNLTDCPNQKWPERLAEFHDVIEHYFKETLKVENAAAHKHADGVTTMIAKHFGGRPFYMPKGKSLTRSLRNLEIFKKFNGRNQDELAEEYDLSVAAIYDIVAKQYKLRQRKLPL
ncbi:Mor transcription activator family protein [Thiomicrorhabdus sp. Kp2]|uniref:Mor transcription activator family protein n=1 Tax=Thiomicrorhabdus sp. Kp2 TaxID=1123518 RepID=UPI0004069BAC|nr:Mor transcription activator family protein [Thiomicrorhabdus sp. Kp2]